MLLKYLTKKEISDELDIDIGTVEDLISGNGEWTTEDINRLVRRLAEKLLEKSNSA